MKSNKYANFAAGFMDMIFIYLSYNIELNLNASLSGLNYFFDNIKNGLWGVFLIYFVSLYFFKLYEIVWKYADIEEFLQVLGGCTIGGIASFIYCKIIGLSISYRVSILSYLYISILILGLRIVFRFYKRSINKSNYFKGGRFERVMIVGAGEAGNLLIKEMRLHREMKYIPAVLIDDDSKMLNKRISGIKVMGNRDKIVEFAEKYNISTIVISIPSADYKDKEEIIDICRKTKCRIKILPSLYSVLDSVNINRILNVDVEDLLGRDSVDLDMNGIADYINGEKVLVTGGGGSIGSELCRQIARFNPKELIILDINENNVYDIENELKYKYPMLNLKILIASVREKERIEGIFNKHRPNVVFHAAAHKHVPLMENNPCEAVKNNIFGTLNIVECSKNYDVRKFVLISTDKAVNPTSVMGATKRICEMIVQSVDKDCSTEFAAVRFGNVLGSSGSVVPLFKKQIAKGGPVTITHSEVTRFFMTIPEAAELVLQAGAYAKGGEIFVLDMGKPVKIYDLACNLIKLSGLEPERDIEIKITGLRPGEKLYEEVLTKEEGLNKTANNKIFAAKPVFLDSNFLKMQIAELKDIVDKDDEEKLILKLEEIVPNYKRNLGDSYI